jgi:hypothetical protein
MGFSAGFALAHAGFWHRLLIASKIEFQPGLSMRPASKEFS